MAPSVATGPPGPRGAPPAGPPRGAGGAQQDAEGRQRGAQETTPAPRIRDGRQRETNSYSYRRQDREKGE